MRIVQTFAIVITVLIIAIGGRFLFLSDDQTLTPAANTSLGGPFTLVNSAGETVTDKDFHGRYMLIYFGYTFCPDVCPTSLSTTAQALAMLPPEKVEKLTPVFVSVDPHRDTPEVVGEYVTYFDDRMVGLTGSDEQVAAAAKAYKVYYQKVEEEGGDPEAYVLDHSALSYLMDPEGNFVTHFSHGIPPKDMADRLAQIL